MLNAVLIIVLIVLWYNIKKSDVEPFEASWSNILQNYMYKRDKLSNRYVEGFFPLETSEVRSYLPEFDEKIRQPRKDKYTAYDKYAVAVGLYGGDTPVAVYNANVGVHAGEFYDDSDTIHLVNSRSLDSYNLSH